MNYTQQTSTWTLKQRDGYPALSDFVAQDPDHETFVFRRFKQLGARNILNLQGELIKLEEDIAAVDQEAADSVDPELHLSMRSWTILDENSRRPGRDLERKQKELANALDEKLKKYCECCPERGVVKCAAEESCQTKRFYFNARLRCWSLQVPES
jgi:hypothetical protein